MRREAGRLTISEQKFEQFWNENGIPCSRLEPDDLPMPDYEIELESCRAVAEVKELQVNPTEAGAIAEFEKNDGADWGCRAWKARTL
jgi:hypothetical protein